MTDAVVMEKSPDPSEARSSQTPPVENVVFFLYYDDVRGAIRWYEENLNLTNVYDDGWVSILEISPRARIGLVSASEGSQKPVPGPNKGALIAIETPNLQDWHRYLKARNVTFVRELHAAAKGRTDAFHILDPGGYTIEFFQWRSGSQADSR